MFFHIICIVLFAGLHVQGYPSVDPRPSDVGQYENVDGNYQNVVDTFDNVKNDASKVVENGLNTIGDVGQEIVGTVKQFGSEAENVNKDVLNKIGDAGKNSVDFVKKGFYNVLNFGQSSGEKVVDQAKNINEAVGKVAKDSSDALKESTNTFIDFGKGMLRSGEQLGEKVDDVSEGIQGVIDKFGNAAKHTTKVLQDGFFAVFGLGQDAAAGVDNKKQGQLNNVENNKKPQGVIDVIGDVTKKTTNGIKNGLSTLFNFGNGLFKFGDNKKNKPDESSTNLAERVDVRVGDDSDVSFDDFKKNLNNEIYLYKQSTSEPNIKSRFKVWKEIAVDTKDTLGDAIAAVKKSISSILAAGGKIAQASVDLQNVQLTIESTLPRMGLKFVNLIFARDKKN